jgi:DNA modification methylase
LNKKFRVIEKLEIGKLLTFKPNKNLPIYSWFYYKEGFSRDLVIILLDRFLKGKKIKEKNILDPFCGVGTTLLACKEYGINSIGFDVLPISIFVSRVKLRDYDINELEITAKKLLKLKFTKPAINVPSFIKKYFSPFILQDVIFFREKIREINDNKIRDFFLLGLMNASMKCSYAFKDGACLKIVKKSVAPLRQMFSRTIRKIIRDLKIFYTDFVKARECRILVDYCDARKLRLGNETVDIIITSPPYLNKIEYTKVYKIEQTLFMEDIPSPPMRSFLGVREKMLYEDFTMIDEIFPPSCLPTILTPQSVTILPLVAKAYLKDLYLTMKELFRVCKSGAKLAIILGDGLVENDLIDCGSPRVCPPPQPLGTATTGIKSEKQTAVIDRYIVVDVLNSCAKIADYIGFKVDRIVIGNKRIATTPKRQKVGILREGIILLEKN